MFHKFDEELLRIIHVISIVVISLYSLTHSVKLFTTRRTLYHLPTPKVAGANTRCKQHIGISFA